MSARELPAHECRRFVEPSTLPFQSTQELGLEIREPRFHVVVVGAPGSGRTFCARAVARRIARTRPTPDDILLLPNPRRPSEPSVLALAPGQGRGFVDAMEELYARLVDTLRGTTEGERWKQIRTKIQRRVNAEESRLEEQLRATAREMGLELQRTETEVQVTSTDDSPPSGESLRTITGSIEEFEATLATVQDDADRELRAALKQLLADGVKGCFEPFRARFEDRQNIGVFLEDVETVVCRTARLLVDEPSSDEPASIPRGLVIPTLLTEHKTDAGAPVVEVPYPTLTSLFGRTHAPPDSGLPPEPGFAVAGALHQANGGFLILPASALLKNESLYEQLKACLLASKIIVPESNPSYLRSTSEELLIPSIEIDLKVILVTSPALYQDLHEVDPEFSQLFKVQARFEPTLPLAKALSTYPTFLADIARDRSLLPLTADAVSELLFHGGRLAESQTKVSAQVGLIAEVALEAGYSAARRGLKEINGVQVLEALAAARRRGSHFRDHVHEMLADGTIRIDTVGKRVGQVNAISVLTDGPQTFGRPCRVTAVVSPGVGGPVNIAREVEMSGPLHSKGVLILTGFLAARFAQHRPLAFSGSVVFEQTYEPIDGDSASSSELYALLSALSNMPLRQEIAVTGSVDQQGSIQPVAGIIDKVEAFYDLCAAKGLTGSQGVLIPTSNRDALMLRSDVVEAIKAGKFHVFEAGTVEDAIELLTGVPAGEPDALGHYPEGSVFGAAEGRLKRFHQTMLEFGRLL
jgi:predicted ATP-dependent protease